MSLYGDTRLSAHAMNNNSKKLPNVENVVQSSRKHNFEKARELSIQTQVCGFEQTPHLWERKQMRGQKAK